MCSSYHLDNVSNPLFIYIYRTFNIISVEMMGLIGMGNNPMVGATVACAVAVEEASK